MSEDDACGRVSQRTTGQNEFLIDQPQKFSADKPRCRSNQIRPMITII